MGNKGHKYQHMSDSPLYQAQMLKCTQSGQPVNQIQTSQILTTRELNRMRRRKNLSPDVRIILNEPFSRVDRITDSLYLTGIAGLTEENLAALKITCIINATYEMPLAILKGIESFRVPVEDEEKEEILIYFESVSDKIHLVSKAKGRTVVHCMAGASRSSTLVIGIVLIYDITILAIFNVLTFSIFDQISRIYVKECFLLSEIDATMCTSKHWFFRPIDHVRRVLSATKIG